jgi:predicted membrane protein
MLLVGAALGTVVAFLVLALGGAVVRIPGVLPLLDRFLTAEFDAPLMWVLMVSSWLLGIVIAYALAVRMWKSRGAGPRSE